MTTIQKIAVTAALAATIGAGIYEAKQARDARNEISEMKAEHEPLTNEIANLRAENQQLSNSLTATKDQQKLTQSQLHELMKLRGQSGEAQTAEKELAKAQAALKNQKYNMPGYLTNAMAIGMKTAFSYQKKEAAAKIARMKTALNLSDDQVQAITDITMRHLEKQNQMAFQALAGGGAAPDTSSSEFTGQAEADEIKAQLTPDQLAQYQAFQDSEKTVAAQKSASTEAEYMAGELGLSADQQQQIQSLLVQNALSNTNADAATVAAAKAAARGSGDYSTAMNLSMQIELQNLTNNLALFQNVLTPEQLQQYQRSKMTQIDMMKSAMSMFMPQTNNISAQ